MCCLWRMLVVKLGLTQRKTRGIRLGASQPHRESETRTFSLLELPFGGRSGGSSEASAARAARGLMVCASSRWAVWAERLLCPYGRQRRVVPRWASLLFIAWAWCLLWEFVYGPGDSQTKICRFFELMGMEQTSLTFWKVFCVQICFQTSWNLAWLLLLAFVERCCSV